MKIRPLHVVAILGLAALCAGLLAPCLRKRPSANPPATSPLGTSFEYDLSALKTVPPALLKWREIDSIPLPFKEARALAVGPQGQQYVAGDLSLIGYAPPGEPSLTVETAGPVQCLAADVDGTLFLGMRDHVEVLRPGDQTPVAWASLGEQAVLTSIAVGERNVFVADAGNRIVIRYDRSGKELNRIGAKDAARGLKGFFVPSPYFDLAVDDGDSVWAVDPGRHALMRFREDGDLISSWERTSMGIDGFCGCCNPTHIALRPDGSFVTSEKGIARVKIHAPTGDLVAVVAGPDAFAEGTVGLDLAVDSKGRILVLDPVRRAVRIFVESQGVSR